MPAKTLPGGTFTLADNLTVTRMGYGAMQLAGPGVFGPPADRAAAVTVLREVVELGITHIDTSDYYGPYVTNEIIREALFPYPHGLHIVTKVGAFRDADGGWPPALEPDQLRRAVHENLEHLGVDVLDVVNLRVGGLGSPEPGSIAEPFTVLAELQQGGLIRHLGLSTVSADQITEARSIAPVVCVQNMYNLAHRVDDELVDWLAGEGDRLRPLLPAGRLLTAPVGNAAVGRRPARRHPDGRGPGLAPAALAEHPPHPRHLGGPHLRENVAAAGLKRGRRASDLRKSPRDYQYSSKRNRGSRHQQR